jgi:hypothetical protein
MKKFLLTLSLVSALVTNSYADTIRNDTGGYIAVYNTRLAQYIKYGTQIKIAGRCDSACTIYLALPANQICITKQAAFGFHAASARSTKTKNMATKFLLGKYPQWVKNWINSNGGLSNRLITMKYDYAKNFMRSC